MQSIAVYSSRKPANHQIGTGKSAINLIRNILNEYTNKSLLFQLDKSNTLLTKLKLLILKSNYNYLRRPYAITQTSSMSSLGEQRSSSSPQTTITNKWPSFLWASLLSSPPLKLELAQKALHLITAYSGYSKEFLNSTYNTNIKTTKLNSSSSNVLENNKSNHRLSFGNNRKGCIGDDAWFIAKQSSADVLG